LFTSCIATKKKSFITLTHQAWEDGGQTVLALVKRGLESQLLRRVHCISNILENSKPEVVKEIADAMKPETMKRFRAIRAKVKTD
jgi:hypothetical protein